MLKELLERNPDIESLGVVIRRDTPLSQYTTFKLGGICPILLECQTPRQLETVVKYFLDRKIDFILIGGGSNLVVSDRGVDCAVIRYACDQPIVERKGDDIIVSGSTNLDSAVVFALEQGLEGLNYCSGIPGTVGGAVVGNAGAFGKQVGDIIRSVVLIDKQGKIREAAPSELGFSYRNSELKNTKEIVVSVTFALRPGNKEDLSKERSEILTIRKEKHPDLQAYPCAGSFFRNIEPTSKAQRRQAAGWFLDQAGGKQLRVGGAAIYEKHANIIVKSENCTAQNVFELSQMMSSVVKKQFNLDLIREVRFVGKFDNASLSSQEIIW